MYNNFIEFIIGIITNNAADAVSYSLNFNTNLAIFSLVSSIIIVTIASIFIKYNQFKHFENIVIGSILTTYIFESMLMLQGETISLLKGVMKIALGFAIYFVFYFIKKYFSIPE